MYSFISRKWLIVSFRQPCCEIRLFSSLVLCYWDLASAGFSNLIWRSARTLHWRCCLKLGLGMVTQVEFLKVSPLVFGDEFAAGVRNAVLICFMERYLLQRRGTKVEISEVIPGVLSEVETALISNAVAISFWSAYRGAASWRNSSGAWTLWAGYTQPLVERLGRLRI